jgi:hypothetical protein
MKILAKGHAFFHLIQNSAREALFGNRIMLLRMAPGGK